MFIACAQILWAFDFTCPTDLLPDVQDELRTWSDGFISVPKIFPTTWKARNKAKEIFIRQRFEEVQTEWKMEGLTNDERLT